MTNNIDFLADIDTTYPARDILDAMLDFADSHDLISETIDHYADDCHAAPDAYLPASRLFRDANRISFDDDDLTDFYDRFNSDDFILSFRMILESLAAELDYARTQCDEYSAKILAILA